MESCAGRILGDYRIIEEIGAGGMGRVYLAENVHHRKPCALKVLPEELSRDIAFRARFFDEARVMSDLNHPGIVRVHHMGEDKGLYYLVMDYVSSASGRSHSIHDELAQSPARRIAPSKAHRWITQVAQALAYAHHKGVIHRDIKPANILVDAESNTRVTDFGLAKAVGKDFLLSQIHKTLQQTSRAVAPEATAGGLGLKLPGVLHDFELAQTTRRDLAEGSPGRRSGSGDSGAGSGSYSLFGTYDYMSPELLEGKEATVQSDIYSLGVMTYRMLTGRRPVGLAKPPSTIVRGLSRKWDTITGRCLADNAADRYPSVDALLEDLQKIDHHSRQRLVVAVALVFLAGVSSFVAWTHLRPSTPSAGTGVLKPIQAARTEVRPPGKANGIPKTGEPLVAAIPAVPTRTDKPGETGAQGPAGKVPPRPEEKNTAKQDAPTEKTKAQSAQNLQLPAETPPAVSSAPPAPSKPSSTTIVKEEIEKHLQLVEQRSRGDEFLRRVRESIPQDSTNLADLNAWEIQTKELATFVGGGSWPDAYDREEFYQSEDGRSFRDRKPLQPGDLRAWQTALGGYPKGPDLTVKIPDPTGKKEIELRLQLIKAKGLWFQMGIPRDRTSEARDPLQKPVQLPANFYLGQCEITQRQYQAVMRENPSLFQDDPQHDPNRPVERVSWDQAVEFCTTLCGRTDLRFLLSNGSEYPITGPTFRLPSEQEWEYACRAQDGKKENPPANWPEYLDFHNAHHPGQSLGDAGWHGEEHPGASTHLVGRLKSNDFGLHDMHGNVWEWCSDEYKEVAGGKPGGTGHVLRGGAYNSPWRQCRSGSRDGFDKPRANIGFRVVLEVK